MQTIYFITHPDVLIDPTVPVPKWPLSPRGVERMRKGLKQSWINTIRSIYSSTEQKAIDSTEILASYLSIEYHMLEELGEIDRSATGYLARNEYEALVEVFFRQPYQSVQGWERASDAQNRIVRAIDLIIDRDKSECIAIVSHGGVGALYLCYLKNRPIDPSEDQPPTNGGNFFAFDGQTKSLLHGWELIDK